MEEYKTIADYENYEVSNKGNVRNKITSRILRPRYDKAGYHMVYLCKDGKATNKKIHRLICQAFLDNPDDKPIVDHIDGNPSNNNLENLRWATNKENLQNSKIPKNNTSGFKGVTFHKPTNKWRAYIHIDGITIHIGLFENIEDVKAARIARANQVFGNFTNSCELLKA